MSEFTRAEACAVAIAEAFRGDGELLVSPIGTLPSIGAPELASAARSVTSTSRGKASITVS